MKTARSELSPYMPVSPAAARSDTEVPVLPMGGEDAFADSVTVPGKMRASIRILVIDDDRTLREGCASLLQVEGYSVTTSTNTRSPAN